jgi:uncharacterized membrane protein
VIAIIITIMVLEMKRPEELSWLGCSRWRRMWRPMS